MDIYPPAAEIAAALQDRGKAVHGKHKGKPIVKHKFPLIEKLAMKLYNGILLHFGNPEGLTKNVPQGKQPLFKEIVLGHCHMDVAMTDPFFHPYQIDGKVYIISNDSHTCGLDKCVQNFEQHVQHESRKKNSARTCNDRICLGCILLDNAYRDSVAGIMTKKDTRRKSDVPGDSNESFFEKILDDTFSNEYYVVSTPPEEQWNEILEDDRDDWDPNHPDISEHERDTKWLYATWSEYIRPRYKKALDKWNKDTGGGDSTPNLFIDFCSGDRWLIWIFLKDREANFLLANNAGGRMPKHLQCEAGFDDGFDEEVSSLEDSNQRSSNASSNQKRVLQLDRELEAALTQRRKLENAVDKVATLATALVEKNSTTDSEDDYIKKVAGYSQKMQDENILNMMSPTSKEIYLNSLKKQRKVYLQKLKDDDS